MSADIHIGVHTLYEGGQVAPTWMPARHSKPRQRCAGISASAVGQAELLGAQWGLVAAGWLVLTSVSHLQVYSSTEQELPKCHAVPWCPPGYYYPQIIAFSSRRNINDRDHKKNEFWHINMYKLYIPMYLFFYETETAASCQLVYFPDDLVSA